MSETADKTTPETPAQESQAQPAAETDWKAEARKWEQRAKDNSSAAQRLAQIEEANKTETQKAQDRITAAEKAAEDARSEATRYKIATEFKLSTEDAEALEHVTSEEGMRLIATKLAARAAEQPSSETPSGPYVPAEGHNPSDLALNSDALTEALKRKVGAT